LVITSWLEADAAGGHSIFRIRSRLATDDRDAVTTVSSPARALDIVEQWLARAASPAGAGGSS
jgi:hypothetical protein